MSLGAKGGGWGHAWEEGRKGGWFRCAAGSASLPAFPRMQLHYGRMDQSSESRGDSKVIIPVLPARIPPGVVVSVRAASHGGVLPGAVLT